MAHIDEHFKIGNDVGVFGRWYRLLIGVYFFVFSVLNPILLNPMPRAELAGLATQVGLALAAIIALYLVVFYLIGEWVLSKVTPWVGTLIFLGLPSLLFILGLLPRPVGMAFGLYISASLVLTFFFRYGGCEVVALPSMIFGRRYTMYCPLNAIDAVERTTSLDLAERRNGIMDWVSFLIIAVVGGYFVMELDQILGVYGINPGIDPRWALLLLLPIVRLLHRVWNGRRSHAGQWSKSYLLGVGILVLALLAAFSDQLDGNVIWRWVMVLGVFIAVWELTRRAAGKLRTRGVDATVSAPESA